MALPRRETVALALAKVGVSESPPHSNRVEFSTWYGIIGPWCAMFLSWVLAHAGNASGYRFASTASSVAWARRAGRLIPLDRALPGDVLVRLYTSTTGHTGMVTEKPAGGVAVTVEGNTSGTNDRDGGSVMVRRRSLGWWHYAIALDFPGPVAGPTLGGSTMFSPPLQLPPIVASAEDPTAGGSWLLGLDGAIFAFDGARYLGAVNGKSYWGSRRAKALLVGADLTDAERAARPDGYVIVSEAGERYGPVF